MGKMEEIDILKRQMDDCKMESIAGGSVTGAVTDGLFSGLVGDNAEVGNNYYITSLKGNSWAYGCLESKSNAQKAFLRAMGIFPGAVDKLETKFSFRIIYSSDNTFAPNALVKIWKAEWLIWQNGPAIG